MNSLLMEAYQLEQLSIYGMNNYNSLFGDLFTESGLLGMLFKKIYLRYYVNAVAYLPVTFLVIAWIIMLVWAIYFTRKRRDLWIIICVPAMMIMPVLSSIVGGRAETYHSAQYIPLVIMIAFLLLAALVQHMKEKKKEIVTWVLIVVAFGGVTLQIIDINKWFNQDYNKFIEAKDSVINVAEDLIENYDITNHLRLQVQPLQVMNFVEKHAFPMIHGNIK